ncbi:MAG: hypothetical protein FDZ75_01725 [Actinobacteria bacterium]|nr:MAG: hypothetical protein FDZ75_01725 [Actinomycetota bacterium]
MSEAEARAAWPLQEDVDPSVDALAHIYFDHIAHTARRRALDEYDIAAVLDLAGVMAQGDPLDDEVLSGFESVVAFSFDGRHILAAVAILALIVYALTRAL